MIVDSFCWWQDGDHTNSLPPPVEEKSVKAEDAKMRIVARNIYTKCVCAFVSLRRLRASTYGAYMAGRKCLDSV